MIQFEEEITMNGNDYLVSGGYKVTQEATDHVAWIRGGKVSGQDIYSPVVKERDIDIDDVWIWKNGSAEEINPTPDESIQLTEMLADILTENEKEGAH